MDFVKGVKKAIEIVKLNGSAMTGVASDQKATGMGIVIIVIAGVLSAIGGLLTPAKQVLGQVVPKAGIGSVVTMPILMIIVYLIGVGIIHILAKLFGGKAKYMELFRPMSHGSILSWLSILAFVPVLGSLISFAVGIWGFVVTVVLLKNVHKLSTGKAVVVVLIPIVVISILALAIGVAFMAMLFSQA